MLESVYRRRPNFMALPFRVRAVAALTALMTSLAVTAPARAHHDEPATVLPNPGFEDDRDANALPDRWLPTGRVARLDAASAHSVAWSRVLTGADKGATTQALRVALP